MLYAFYLNCIKSEWLPGQYERTVTNKRRFGLHMVKYQPKQHFSWFITCWITSQWNVKTLIYSWCYYFSLSVKSPCEISLWDVPPAGQQGGLTASQSWGSKPSPARAPNPKQGSCLCSWSTSYGRNTNIWQFSKEAIKTSLHVKHILTVQKNLFDFKWLLMRLPFPFMPSKEEAGDDRLVWRVTEWRRLLNTQIAN